MIELQLNPVEGLRRSHRTLAPDCAQGARSWTLSTSDTALPEYQLLPMLAEDTRIHLINSLGPQRTAAVLQTPPISVLAV